MFSNRFPEDTTPNLLSLLLSARQRAGAEILDLTLSNPTVAGLRYPRNIIASAFATGDIFLYQPHARGLLEARESVHEYYRRRGSSPEVEHIHLTASTSEAYAFLMKLLANPGDEILIARPSYPLMEQLAMLESVVLRQFDLRYDDESGWRIDFASLEAHLGERTRAIIVVNPNNPTGSYIHTDDYELLTQLCELNSLALICDEVFFDYAFKSGVRPQSTVSMSPPCLTFTLNGFSKILGLPQMKLAWIITQGPARLVEAALERLDLISDSFLSVGTPIQTAAETLFGVQTEMQSQILARCRSNYEFLRTLFASRYPMDEKGERIHGNDWGSETSVLRVDGGWYAIVHAPRIEDELAFVLRLLEERSVLLHPGYYFDFRRSGYFVISLLPEENIFRKGVEAVAILIRS